MMNKMFSIDEIKVAAMDVLLMMGDGDNVVQLLGGMSELIAALEAKEVLTEQKPEKVAKPDEKTAKNVKSNRNGHCEVVQPGKFSGYGAKLKRRTYDRLYELKQEGKTALEIVNLANGQLKEDDIRAMLKTQKVPFEKWNLLAEALGTKEDVTNERAG